MTDTRHVQTQTLAVTTRHRVIKTHALQAATVALLPAIGHDDMIKGLFFHTAARKTNGYHTTLYIRCWESHLRTQRASTMLTCRRRRNM